MLKASLRRGRGRLQILTAQVSDGTGQISATWFNQPWLKDKLTPGHARAPARAAEPLRLRGQVLRPERRRGDRRLRARLPGERGGLGGEAARARRGGAAHARRPSRPAAGRASRPSEGCRSAADALVAAPPAALARGGGAGQAAGSPSTSCSCSSSRSRAERPSARRRSPPRCREPGELIERYRAALPFDAHRAPGAGDRRDRRRPRAHDADAAPAPGRRRLRARPSSRSTRCCARSRRAARAR